MKITVRSIVIWACVRAALALILATTALGVLVDLPSDPALRLEYYRFALEVYKAIGLGFLITILGALIPQILPEAKYEFDKLKEGREVFSKAKTGIDYLPYQLAELNFKDSMDHLETVHQLKHLAKVYLEDSSQVGGWRYEPYYRITRFRDAVKERTPSGWDSLTREERLDILLRVQEELEKENKAPAVSENSGTDPR